MVDQWRSLKTEYGFSLENENSLLSQIKQDFVTKLIAAMVITPLRQSLFQVDSSPDPLLIKHWSTI